MPFTQFRYYCKIFFQPSASAHHLDKKTTACSCGYSSTLTEALKQRIQVLEVENCRLMTNQGQLVAETNRRVEVWNCQSSFLFFFSFFFFVCFWKFLV